MQLLLIGSRDGIENILAWEKGSPGLKWLRISSPWVKKHSPLLGTEKSGMDVAYGPVCTQGQPKCSSCLHERLNTLLSTPKNFLVKHFLSSAFKDKQIVTNSV